MDAMKIKPFPWMCAECRQKTVWFVRRDYATSALHDDTIYNLVVRDIDVPTCSQCGQAIITCQISEQITSELRRAAGILGPEEIRARRDMLRISQAELAAALRIPEATFALWEDGGQLQTRSMDLLLRLFLDSAEVRRACVSTTNPAAEFSTSPT